MDHLRINSIILRETIAEFAGTFVFMVFTLGSNAQTLLSRGTHGQFFESKFGNALGVMMGVCVAGGISGAHLNPAVTVSLACAKQLNWKKIPLYFLAQYLGAFLASALVYIVYIDAIHLYSGESRSVVGTAETASIFVTFPTIGISQGIGFLDQIVGTSLLLFCIRAFNDKRNMAIPQHLSPILNGLLVLNIGIAFGFNCANALNPARDLGPRLFLLLSGYGQEAFTAHDNWFYVPVVAPHLGGLLGSTLYDLFVHLHWPKEREIILPK